ncbi:hypothetical protein [Streptomyces hygroscopicus]|uniref:hypothetical protein n=1 Tax=Streptomyces hygroscopicus TaxID=1912 RepID=UPI001FCCB6BE|nr:hypothetical protein [Streptomyces hygroscopicus]BDH12400.1 hypothetical protein HOK021_35790 [Streptomyces hygroscopicus]
MTGPSHLIPHHETPWVPVVTRVRVEQAIADPGFARGGAATEQVAHLRRNRLCHVGVSRGHGRF